jgi:hypothetical protein
MDVGGAHGVLLAAVLNANPTAHGILFEQPHVIATAGDAIKAHELWERCELVSGDFFEGLPKGADLHLLKQILHVLDDEQATRLLQVCHGALSAEGKLLVVEMVIPADSRPSPAHASDLNMLVLQPGRERTEDEYRRMFRATGFRLDRIIPTHSPFSVIEATRL